MRLAGSFFLLGLTVLTGSIVPAQESTVYTTVVATRLFVVGAANPRTGLHYQRAAGDTGWHQVGPKTIRAFGMGFFTPSRGRILYIGAGNGVHRSSDFGATWKTTTGWRITEVLGVTPDQHDSNTVYCATEFGVFRSTDGCATWKEMNTGLKSTFISCVIIDRADPRRLFCATEEGAYVSEDRGEHWKRMGLSVGGIRTIVQNPADPLMLIAGTEDFGMYVTRDGGSIWTRTEAGIDHTTFYAIAFNPRNPDTVYAGGYVTGVYRSLDGARSWRRVNDGLTALNIHSIAVDPVHPERIFAAAYWGGVFRSDTAGEKWTPIGLSESQSWMVCVEPY